MINTTVILYELAKLTNEIDKKFIISSSKLGSILGVSQQTASRYLKELEDKELIKRSITYHGQEIQFTASGISILNEICLDLNQRLFKKKVMFKGKIVTGIGEGAYYIKEYMDKIKERLGFSPFPGTLNLKSSGNFKINMDGGITISGFTRDNRTFGEVKCLPVKLSSGKKYINCHLILPQRTHHTDEIEIISKFNLRNKLSITDGDEVELEII